MPLQITTYAAYQTAAPTEGRHILAQQRDGRVLVYQAYNNSIADYALTNGQLGGSAYSYSRMSWIKPNFLWMVYRAGWGRKPNQERILGFWIDASDFDHVLSQCAFSSYQPEQHASHEVWKAALGRLPGRLQWDPDHGLHGEPLRRKAIQLGLRGKLLEAFGREMIREVVDVTAFAKTQRARIGQVPDADIEVMAEEIYVPVDDAISRALNITTPPAP